MANWDEELESTIITRLTHFLKEKYPKITVTSNDVTTAPTSFPTLFVHQIESPGFYYLAHTEKIGINHYMEIQVFAKKRSECKDICYYAQKLMEEWGYNANNLIIKVNSQYAFSVGRYHRIIGSGDIDIVNT